MSFSGALNPIKTSRVMQQAPKKISVTGSTIVNVNNRTVVSGKQVQMEGITKTKDKMELKELMIKAKSDDYKNNPIMARRLQQQIAQKASTLYGISAKKMMGGSLQAASANNFGGHSLNDKVNGRN